MSNFRSPLWPGRNFKPEPGSYQLMRKAPISDRLIGYWDFQTGAEGATYLYGSAAASGLTTVIPNLIRGGGDFSFPNTLSARSQRAYPVIGTGLLFGTPGTDICQVTSVPGVSFTRYAWRVRFGVNGTIGSFAGIAQTRSDGSLRGCINNSAGTSFCIADNNHYIDTPGLLWTIGMSYDLIFSQSGTNITLYMINLLTKTIQTHSITDGTSGNTGAVFTVGNDSSVTTRFGNVHISDFMLWDRTIGDAEARSFVDNPFPFLEPIKRRPKFPTVAADLSFPFQQPQPMPAALLVR